MNFITTEYLVEEISASDHSVKSPRFSPDGKTLVWLQREAGGPHGACLRLLRADVPLNKNVSVCFIANFYERFCFNVVFFYL